MVDESKKIEWWTQGYIGVLWFPDVTVFIGSRFDKFDKDDVENSFFTNYIISKALSVKGLLFQDMKPDVGLEQMTEQLMIIIFVNQIKEAYKHGLYRMYRNFERNDAKVRGKIDVTRHINLNPLFNGKIAYSYREYTPDNDINRIIFTAYSMLEKKYTVFMKGLLNNNRSVKDCINQLGNIVQPLSKQELQKLECRFDVREDVFQVMSYMYTLDCHQGAVICPITVSKEEMENIANLANTDENSIDYFHSKYKISKKQSNDIFHLFAIAIPQKCESYADFTKQMDMSEKNLKKAFEDLLNPTEE